MSEFRELLEREGERFTFRPGGVERLHRRRRRRQRIEIGVVALALAVGGTWLALSFQRVRPAPDPAEAPRIVQRSSIGARPAALAAGEGAVWIASAADRALIRLDPATGKVTNEISLGDEVGPPIDVTIWRGSVWVRSAGVDGARVPAVVRVDAATDRVAATYFLDHDTRAVAVGEGSVWSANGGTGAMYRRDLSRGRVTASGHGPIPPVALAVGDGVVWALGGGQGDVDIVPPDQGAIARIDPRTGSTSSTEVGRNPQDLAVGAGAVWVVSTADHAVFRVDLDTVTVTNRIPVPGLPGHITVGPSGAWVLDAAGGMLFHIDPDGSRITGSVRVGPGAVAVGVEDRSVWVARADGTILRVQD